MGRGRPGSGVEPLKDSIRISFTWNGKRRRENIPLKPTSANIKAAERMVAEIKAEIRAGTFHYARHFPDSPDAKTPTTLSTFKDYAEHWLTTLTVAHSTARLYRNTLKSVWIPALGMKALKDIRHSDVKAVQASRVGQITGLSVNREMIPLRGVFNAAMDDGLIPRNPTERVRAVGAQSPVPDPFTTEEVQAILSDLRKHYPEQIVNWYEFAFNTGMRPSEQIALRWGDVDWTASTIRVARARTKAREKGTKTNRIRDVDLNPAALGALTQQKKFSFMKGVEAAIFTNPNTGLAWSDESKQREMYFTPALRRLGLRHRAAYQTRHTYATAALMRGVNPAYIARQMGHASTAMLFRHYSKWIDGADRGREAKKMVGILSTDCPRADTGH